MKLNIDVLYNYRGDAARNREWKLKLTLVVLYDLLSHTFFYFLFVCCTRFDGNKTRGRIYSTINVCRLNNEEIDYKPTHNKHLFGMNLHCKWDLNYTQNIATKAHFCT